MNVLKTPFEKAVTALASAVWAACIIILIIFWADIPNRIPTHFGMSGLPDSWGGKASLVFPVIVGLGCDILMAVCRRFPKTWNTGVRITEENRERVYALTARMLGVIRLCMAFMFSYLIYCSAAAKSVNTPLLLALIFAPMLWYLVKIIKAK